MVVGIVVLVYPGISLATLAVVLGLWLLLKQPQPVRRASRQGTSGLHFESFTRALGVPSQRTRAVTKGPPTLTCQLVSARAATRALTRRCSDA
jgi:hypothetical protein